MYEHDEEKRYVTELIAENITLLSPKIKEVEE